MGPGFIKNWSSFVLLQIGASVITIWGSLVITKCHGRRYSKLGQTLLQITAAITNWGNYYKLGHITHEWTLTFSKFMNSRTKR